MLRGEWLAALVVTIALLANPAAAGANEAPLAEAGLDQTVTQGATVYLDAGGSVDPDGTIEQYRWAVVAPNGTTVHTATTARTSFQALDSGNYTATVTVTDDAGASRSDTLRVRVRPSEPPRVDLSGPSNVTNGTNGTYTATAKAGGNFLSTLKWERNGSVLETQNVTGIDAGESVTVGFNQTGKRTVSATAVDTVGRIANETVNVTVEARDTRGRTGSSGGGGGSGRSTYSYGTGTAQYNEEFTRDPDGSYTLTLYGNDDLISGSGYDLADDSRCTHVGCDTTDNGIKKDAILDVAKQSDAVETHEWDVPAQTKVSIEDDSTVANNIQESSYESGSDYVQEYGATSVNTKSTLDEDDLLGSDDSGGGSSSPSDGDVSNGVDVGGSTSGGSGDSTTTDTTSSGDDGGSDTTINGNEPNCDGPYSDWIAACS